MPYRSTPHTEAQRLSTRRRVVAAALTALAKAGYQATTMADVARVAGVGVGTVYRQFPSKPELFQEAYGIASRRELDVVAGELAGDLAATERVAGAVRASASRAMAGRTLGRVLLSEPTDPGVEAERLRFRAAYRDLFATTIAEGVASGELPAQDAALSATALMGAIVEVLFGPISPVGDEAPGAASSPVTEALVAYCRGILRAGAA